MGPKRLTPRLAFFVPLLLGLLVFAAWRSPSPKVAPYDPISIDHGMDLLKADGTLHLAVPANFFASGSSAFNGDVGCTGTPLKTMDAWEIGTATTALERMNDVVVPSTGSVDIYQRTFEFGIQAVSQIVVTVGTTTQNWTVTAGLSSARCSVNTFHVARSTSSGGSFSGTMSVCLIVTFKRGSQVKTMDYGEITLTASSGSWTTIVSSSSAALAVGKLPLGFAFSSTSFTSTPLSLSVSPPAVNTSRPGPAYVDSTATIDSAVGCLGRYCSIGAGATIGAGAVIGPYATVASNAHINANAVIADYASIGSGSTVGSDSYVDSNCVVGSGTTIGTGCAMEKGSSVGANCTLSNNCFIGFSSVVQDGCSIGADAVVQNSVHIGANSVVASAVRIDAGASVASGTNVSTDLIQVELDDGSTAYVPGPMTSWSNPPNMLVCGTIGSPDPMTDPPPDPPGTTTRRRANAEHPPVGGGSLAQLANDIGVSVAANQFGGSGMIACRGGCECSWFVEKLDDLLKSLSYTTTFTCTNQLNPAWKAAKDKLKIKKWLEGHALTDVHWGDGSTTWIDAYLPNGRGIDHDVNHWLDGNGDGSVTFTTGMNGDEPTDGDMNVRVYANRDEAKLHGERTNGL